MYLTHLLNIDIVSPCIKQDRGGKRPRPEARQEENILSSIIRIIFINMSTKFNLMDILGKAIIFMRKIEKVERKC